MRYRLTLILFLACAASLALAESGSRAGEPGRAGALTITQIDTSRLLSAQETRLYVSAPGLDPSRGLEGLSVYESTDGEDWESRPIASLSAAPNEEAGISFYLLVDNSGSMWTERTAGRGQAEGGERRIAAAQAAAGAFLGALSAKDGVGLAVFNTRYWEASPAGGAAADATRALDEISRPSEAEAFTELYLSVERGLEALSKEPGRRVLIVLSDGEDYPFYRRTGKPNPDSGLRQSSPILAAERAARDGITVYAIRFGPDRDPLLGSLASETGGRVFDAMDGLELASVYAAIRADVLSEFALDYRAGMAPGDRRLVRVEAQGPEGRRLGAARHYYSGGILGGGVEAPPPYLFLLAVAALGIWLLLVLSRLERETDRAGLRLLYGPGGRAGRATRFFDLAGDRTIVGSGSEAGITIAGNPSLRSEHATIVHDPAKASYTIVSDAPVTVNNRPVTKRRLESGDVINLAGTVVVFDEPPASDRPR